MTLRKLSFTVILIALQVAFVEIALQAYYRVSSGDWLWKRVDIPLFEADDVRVYRVKPNLTYRHTTNEFNVAYHTDDLGLRAPDPTRVTPVAKRPGTYRILFLGPSFTFGTAGSYDDIFVTRIARQLDLPGLDVDVVNLGTPGQPVRWQLCWVEQWAAAFDFDLIVQTVYGEPVVFELRCDKSPPLAIIEDGYLYTTKPTLRKRLFANAKKIALVFYSWYFYQLASQDDESSQGLGTEFYSEPAPSYAEPDEVVAAFREYLDTVHGYAGDGARIVFLHVPYSFVVHPQDAKRFAALDVPPPEEIAATADLVDRTLAANGIDYIDPLDALRANARNERQYNFVDVHFTPAGNATVAEVAAPRLREIILRELADRSGREAEPSLPAP